MTTADGPPRPERYRVDWVSRAMPVGRPGSWPWPRRSGRARRRADVVYATSMIGRARARIDARPAAARHQAHDGPGVRARPALRAVRRRHGRVPGRGRRPPRPCAPRASRDVAPASARRGSSVRARICARWPWRWGCRRAGARDSEPGSPTCRSCRRATKHAPRSASTGLRSRLPGGSAARRRWRSRLEAVSRVAGVRLLVAGDGPERRGDGARLASRARRASSARCRARTCCGSSAPRTRASCPRRGRTSRTRSSSRSPSALP